MSHRLLSASCVRTAVSSYAMHLHQHRSALPCTWRMRDMRLMNRQPARLQHVAALHALSAADRQEITELCYKFDDAINRHDHTGVVDLFTPEGTLLTPKGASGGTAALLQYLKAVQPMAQGNRHLSLNVLVHSEGEGDTAAATSYRLLHRASNPPTLLAGGTIKDTVVKEGGRWKFLERKFEMDPLATPPTAN